MSCRKAFSLHPHWADVVQIIESLENHGYQAVLAGGCVRDALLGLSFHDFDIATSALPSAVEKIFPRTVAVGKNFGVIKVVMGTRSLDVATFRRDGFYADGRHPNTIQFSSLQEDALRRDFTVNALFYSLKEDKVIDFVGGEHDIKNKILRAVGDPFLRFKEDHLRLLRALRFALKLNFSVDQETWQALRVLGSTISTVSKERLTEELEKIFSIPNKKKSLSLLLESSLIDSCFKKMTENNFYRKYISLSQSVLLDRIFSEKLNSSLEKKDIPLSVLLAWWAHGLNASLKEFEVWLFELKLSKKNKDLGRIFYKGIEALIDPHTRLGKKLTFIESNPYLQDFWPFISDFKSEFNKDIPLSIMEYFNKISSGGKLPRALVDGHDLLKLKIKQGPGMAQTLEDCYYFQLENNELDKEPLLNKLKQDFLKKSKSQSKTRL
ncbi:MAG: CCA tRNA nucleotidyltransferase [Bdellovibrionales bacterium]|nr:CCA tRNA nucleotidyltransferase [Bdellovibrionales bacterium]